MFYRVVMLISSLAIATASCCTAAFSKSETLFIYHESAEPGTLLGEERWGLNRAACEAACAGDAGCQGYQGSDHGSDGTEESSLCRLLSSYSDEMLTADSMDEVDPNSGVWVKSSIDVAVEGSLRRNELARLAPDLVEMADRMRKQLPAPLAGETFDSLFDAPYPQGVDTMFEHGDIEGDMGVAYIKDALFKLKQALSLTNARSDWLEAGNSLVAYSVYLTELGRADQKSTILEMFDLAVPTAANVYLLSRDAYERSVALELLASALFKNGDDSTAEKALQERQAIWPDGRVDSLLAEFAGNEDSPALRRSDAEQIE